MIVLNWGLIDYDEAVKKQLSIVEEVAEGATDVCVVCEHPPVVTAGRATQPGDIFAWQGSVIETSRGGRVTYHGPNQLVVYPIINLNRQRKSIPPRDIHGYLRCLENSLVHTLDAIGLKAEVRTTKASEDLGSSLTGVWVAEKKVASIGIAVKKWVTYHGLALNVNRDERAFSGIKPCGFSSEIMTDVETELVRINKPMIFKENIAKVLTDHLTSSLN